MARNVVCVGWIVGGASLQPVVVVLEIENALCIELALIFAELFQRELGRRALTVWIIFYLDDRGSGLIVFGGKLIGARVA
jgi:hypothetical protein